MNEEQKTFFSDHNFSCFKMFSSCLVFMDEYMKRHLVVHVFYAYAFFYFYLFQVPHLCSWYGAGVPLLRQTLGRRKPWWWHNVKKQRMGSRGLLCVPFPQGAQLPEDEGAALTTPLPALCTSEATKVGFDIQNGHSSQLQSFIHLSIHPFHQCQHISWKSFCNLKYHANLLPIMNMYLLSYKNVFFLNSLLSKTDIPDRGSIRTLGTVV